MALALPLPHAAAWPSPRAAWRRWREQRSARRAEHGSATTSNDPPGLDPELARALLAEVDLPQPFPGVFGGRATVWEQRRCPYCEGVHARACPRVREIEYHADGAVKRVAYWPDGRWSDAGILWLDDVQAAAMEAG